MKFETDPQLTQGKAESWVKPHAKNYNLLAYFYSWLGLKNYVIQ